MGPIEKQGVVQAYTMLVPTVAIVMAIVLFPLIANFWISFKDVTVSDLRIAEIKVTEKFQKKPKTKGDISKVEYRFNNFSKSSNIKNVNFKDILPKGLLIKELSQIHEKLKQNTSISKNIDNIVVKKIKELNFIYLIAEDYPNKSLKTFIDEQKKQYNKNSVSLIISNNDNKLSIVLGVTEDITDLFDASKEIREISIILGGKGGGGRKDLAQGGGSDVSQINESIKYVEDKLNSIS